MDTIKKKMAFTPSVIKSERYFLDIETTGLCKQSDMIFCIGIMFVDKGSLTSYQWIIDNPEEEFLLLTTFIDFTKDFEIVITYSGKQFDIPFLIARLNTYDLSTAPLDNLPHIDLKRFSILKLLSENKSLNRRALETTLGFKREIQLDGKEIIKMYKLYASSKNSSHQALLLQHNEDELLSAYFFYEFYYIFNQFSFDKLELLTIDSASSKLKIVNHFDFLTSCNFTYMNLFISWENFTNSVFITIVPEELILRKYLTPSKDYVYISSQNQIMHKSVAQFIPKEFKEKILKEQCFLTKKGSYLQLPSQYLLDLPIWYNDVKNSFIDYEAITTKEDCWQYIKQLIIPRIL
ncbi:MAG: ribonuclease H-like domain-containing protein [Cellulosilyticaceae bacterium]